MYVMTLLEAGTFYDFVPETNKEQKHSGYYEVVAGPADFIVKAETMDESKAIISEYCLNNPKLHIDPVLDMFIGRSLSEEEAVFREKVAGFATISLMRYIDWHTEKIVKPAQRKELLGQQRLFSTEQKGTVVSLDQ